MPRNYSLDLVKVIAMMMVLLLHTSVFSKSYIPVSDMKSIVNALSSIAVPLFFMVSGYIMIGRSINKGYVRNKAYHVFRLIFITTSIALVFYNAMDYIGNGRFTSRGFGIHSYVSWTIQKGFMWHYWYFASMLLLYCITAIVPQKFIFSCRALTTFIIISFISFILDLLIHFESEYIPQSLRLYYWLMFYSLGGWIHKNRAVCSFINWHYVLLISMINILFQLWCPNIEGTEFYFGSFLTMVYAVCVFCACLNTNIGDGIIIREMSNLFLPVYSLHVLLFDIFRHIEKNLEINPEWGFLVLCIVHCFLTIMFCWLLMRNNLANNVFKL